MKRRALMAGMVGGVMTVGQLASGQSPTSRLIPTRTGLAQLGLERSWFNIVPLASGAARVSSMNLTGEYLFAQTTDGLVVCYNAESGQRLWTSNLHLQTLVPAPVSVNDRMAVVAVGQKIFGLDLKTGTKIWDAKLEDLASGGTSVNSRLAIAALKNGKVQAFNVEDPGVDTCGERHDPTVCKKLKPSVGSYLYSWQTEKAITSKPLMNEKLMAFASQDGKVYMASLKDRKIIHRVMTKGPIRGNMGLYGVQQLLVGSDDHKIYSIDLFEPENEATNWVFPTSAPLDHAVVVAGDDAYTVTKDGILYAINAKQGTEKWQLQIGKAKLLAITPTKIYGVTVDGAMAVVNRADGTVAVTPEQSYHSFGVDLKNYSARLANDRNDRIYLASDDGLLLCLRELGQVNPTPLRDPKLPKFGTTPQEIYEMNEPQEAPKKPEIEAGSDAAAPAKADEAAPKEN